jgi:hypothetical protein
MARESHAAAVPLLEGLLLFDGAEYYELPFAVVARYRVPEERRDEVRANSPSDGHGKLPWLVIGGIYAPEEPR